MSIFIIFPFKKPYFLPYFRMSFQTKQQNEKFCPWPSNVQVKAVTGLVN